MRITDMQDLSDALRDEWEQEQLELQSEEAARPDPR